MKKVPTSKRKRIKGTGGLNGTSGSVYRSTSNRCPAQFAFRAFAGYRLTAIHLQQGLPTGTYTGLPEQAGEYEGAIRNLGLQRIDDVRSSM